MYNLQPTFDCNVAPTLAILQLGFVASLRQTIVSTGLTILALKHSHECVMLTSAACGSA